MQKLSSFIKFMIQLKITLQKFPSVNENSLEYLYAALYITYIMYTHHVIFKKSIKFKNAKNSLKLSYSN